MEISMPQHMLAAMLLVAAESGATAALSKAGIQRSTICKQEACRLYGRKKVERWITEGRIKKTKADKWEIDRVEIELLHKTTATPSLTLIKQKS